MIFEKITYEECIKLYNIEIHFLEKLNDSGLLKKYKEQETSYVLYEDLPNLEKFMRWHYDMDINLEGIEVIHTLVEKMERLQNENRLLLEKVNFLKQKNMTIDDI